MRHSSLTRLSLALSTSLLVVSGYISEAEYVYREDRPLQLMHRGDYGNYPENSLAGFISAYYEGADFIEFDVQVTKDAQLVIMHDPNFDRTSTF